MPSSSQVAAFLVIFSAPDVGAWTRAFTPTRSESTITSAATASAVLSQTAVGKSKVTAGTEFAFTFDIGRHEGLPTEMPKEWAGSSRLLLAGLQASLSDAPAEAGAAKLPGADGPHPRTSSGAQHVALLGAAPSFVSQRGKVDVPFERGAWEFIWRDGAAAGNLVLGFNMPDGASRNDASIPAGGVYLSFAVWEAEALRQDQADAAQQQLLLEKARVAKDKALEDMNGTSNLVTKALKFREACVAMETIELKASYLQAGHVPQPGDVVALPGDSGGGGSSLQMVTLGTVWCKGKGMANGRHLFLGTCKASLRAPEETL